MVPRLRRSGDGDLALRVEGFLPADRRDHDRAVVFHPENVGAHVDLADIDEAARPQLEFQEAFSVGAQRDFVVDAGGHVTEMRRRHVHTAGCLEIEDVDRLLGSFDQFVGLQRRPEHRI